MNVRFEDKFSATCFHNTLDQPGHEYLGRWLLRFFTGGWCDHESDFPEDLRVLDLWTNQHGELGELRIACSTKDAYRHPDFPDVLISDYFDWSIWGLPVDNYGRPKKGQENRIMVGGLMNHGDLENPSWSSNT